MTPSAAVEVLRRGQVADAIRRYRLIVILRRVEPRERLVGLVEELAGAGARVFEVTFDAPSAADDLAALRERLAVLPGRPDEPSSGPAAAPFLLGAGTLLTLEQLSAARAAGADFGVAPILDPDVVRAAVEAGFPFLPGAFTPTEIAAAWRAGATFVKLFPASVAGPAMIRELRGPLPEIELIPTGGVDASNAAAFLGAGAVAVGIGGALVRADARARRALVASLTGDRWPAERTGDR